VTNVYGFGFLMCFDPLYLETDVQKITPKPTFAGPYEYSAVYVGPDTTPIGAITAGQIFVALVRPSEKAGICGAVVPVADVIFHTIWEANTTNTQLPTPKTTTIGLTFGFVMVKCDLANNQYGWAWPGPGEYDSDGYANIGGMIGYSPSWIINNAGLYYGPVGGPYTFIAQPGLGLIVGAPINYAFKPSIYDLNLDCVVDVQDLKVLLPYYSKTLPTPNNFGDLYADPAFPGLVDIFDFVAIAKKFGPVDP